MGGGPASGASGLNTTQLQTPTAYGLATDTPPSIYAAWQNIDMDGDANTTEVNDFWHFGTNGQYPALQVDFNGDDTAGWRGVRRAAPPGPAPEWRDGRRRRQAQRCAGTP